MTYNKYTMLLKVQGQLKTVSLQVNSTIDLRLNYFITVHLLLLTLMDVVINVFGLNCIVIWIPMFQTKLFHNCAPTTFNFNGCCHKCFWIELHSNLDTNVSGIPHHTTSGIENVYYMPDDR